MSIVDKDILKLSELAKLYIDESNQEVIVKHINNILSLVEKLNNIDINDIEPMFHSDEKAKQRLRLDIVTETNVRDSLQGIANKEKIESGLYLVPKVID